MSSVVPIDLKTSEVVQVTPEKFSELLVAGKKDIKKKKDKKKPLPPKRSKSVGKKSNDYCFECKSLTENKGTVVNSPYRQSKCASCGSDKKAFVNP
jgi:hypothetical protein